MQKMAPNKDKNRILQFSHGYDGPFLDVAQQYAMLFRNTSYHMTHIFLTGEPNAEVTEALKPDEVLFLGYKSPQIRGLKLSAIRDVRRIVANRNFALCIAHRFKPTYISCLTSRLPIISVHHHSLDLSRLMRRVFANLYQHRLMLLGVSDTVKNAFIAQFPNWPEGKIETLHNRIDIERVQAELFSRESARTALGLSQDAFIIGNVGRLHPDKDQATLLQGFAQAVFDLPGSSQLAIMGKGHLEENLRKTATDLGIIDRVFFLGQVPQARRFFKAFDVFALTSVREACPMALLEALAAGIPTVASSSKDSGASEIIAGVGKLYAHGNASELAGHLVDLSLTDPASQQSSQSEGFKRLCDGFSHQAAIKKFWSLPQIKNFLKVAEKG